MIPLLAIVYLSIVFIRPGEIVSALAGVPLLPATAAMSGLAVAWSRIRGARWTGLSPLDGYMLAYWATMVLSNPFNGWFGGATVALGEFLPVVVCYFLVRFAVQDVRMLRRIGFVLVLLCLFQAGNGILQRQTGLGLGNVAAMTVYDPSDEDLQPDERTGVLRIRGTGIFNDANDLSMTLVMVVPFLLTAIIRKGSGLFRRLAASAGLATITTAIYFANSRGGTLGLGVAVATVMFYRYGRRAGILVAAVGLAAILVLAPSRMARVDSSEASAQGRIQAWAAGIQMFKTNPLIGVGYGRYDEYHERVAHNSFVHSFAELGVIGGTCFLGMVYWAFRGLRGRLEPPLGDETAALRASVGGVLTCMMFLSRQYNVVPYVMLALCASREAMAFDGQDARAGASLGKEVALLGAATVLGIAGTYVVVLLLAAWSGA